MTSKGPKGEGSYAGTRRYNQATKEFLETHDVDKLAKDAARAVENDDGSLESAERAGRRPAKG